ncbi:capsular polysaccharide biosynthesis protein [Caballeronia sp. LZ029]|uniref:capsular polysaccharide biosynthesis protein n=1 Tax=Caballeronia sp. LZ029 TaxID=3038564 RepID=UPI0028609104|nr:capsular polysaccharide biosynthesis protein [Caballeronia sp. LZ029]MDR5744501.1 capsular polysaccharide biosynthesis protein [Caballeronia sp. LZ029]
MTRAIGIVSAGIWRIPHLDSLLAGTPVRVRGSFGARKGKLTAIAGWGAKPGAERARRLARAHGVPYLALEDGFLRSLGLGVNGAPPLSIVEDDLGIYYDARHASRLERLIAECGDDAYALQHARRGIDAILRHRLSKYNDAPALRLPLATTVSRVLVVDQTAGDVSVSLGGANADTFARMLAAAQTEHPDAEIWVKTHPDVSSGRKRGYLGGVQAQGRVRVLADACCPLSLIEQFDHVYVVTSQLGFEALMLGKPVTCFGMPWYAGWRLTDDRHPGIDAVRRRRAVPRSIEQLFAAAYLQYARYLDPVSGQPGTLFDVIDWLARNREINEASRGTLYCVGMSMWKRAVIRPFLSTPSNRLRFVPRLEAAQLDVLEDDARLVVWGGRHAELCRVAKSRGVGVTRVEDGFVRSVGLGSDLRGPLSLAVDDEGIYYDPASGSRLERLAHDMNLEVHDRLRAARLREALVRMRISKYNVGVAYRCASAAGDKRRILVPGQVEDDQSILAGSPHTRRNLDLLAAVRETNPDAWIVYKPHPDVVARNRSGGVDVALSASLADECVIDANISDCIAEVDEVHTMTSLAGFEALLRGKVVHCYGGPFYAGWGLTVDHMALPHRTRELTLDELVYVALCAYPRYRLPGVRGFCSIEDAIGFLVEQGAGGQVPTGSHRLARQWRKGVQVLRAFVASLSA